MRTFLSTTIAALFFSPAWADAPLTSEMPKPRPALWPVGCFVLETNGVHICFNTGAVTPPARPLLEN